MSGLLPSYLMHQWGNDLKALSGGYIYFYQSGTLVPKTVYQDAALTIPHTNPVQLSAEGTEVIFLAAGAYRVWIKDAVGQQVAPWVDGISGSGGGGTGSEGSNGSFAMVKTYNDLRAFLTVPDAIYVCGRNTDGDGGEGWFELITASTMTDDDGVILCSGAGSNVYRRVFTASIDPRWYGVTYNTSIDNTPYINQAFTKSLVHNYPVQITGSVFIAQTIYVPSHASVIFTDDGYLTASTPVSIYFNDQSKMTGSGRCFGTNVSPHYGILVADIIKLSWMGGQVDDDILTKLINAPGAWNTPILIDYPINTTLTSFNVQSPVEFLPSGNINFVTGTNALTISVPNIVDSGYPMLIIPNNAAITLLDFGNQYAKPDWFSLSGQDRAIYYALKTGKCEFIQNKTYSATTAFGALPSVIEIIGKGTLQLTNNTTISTQYLTIRDISVVATNGTYDWATATTLFRAFDAAFPSLVNAPSKVINGCTYTDDALGRAPVSDGKPGLYNAHLPLIPNARSLETDGAGKIIQSASFKYDLNNWNCVAYYPHYEASGAIGFTIEYPTTGSGYIWALSSRGRSDRAATLFRRAAGDVDGFWSEQHIPVPAQLVGASGWTCQGFKALGSLYVMFVKSYAGSQYMLTIWTSYTPFDANSWTLKYQGAQVANSAITWDFDYIARDGNILYASAGAYSPGIIYKVASDGTVTTQSGAASNLMSIIGYDYDNHKILAGASISGVSNFGISADAGLTWTWYPITDANLYGAAHCTGTLYSISGIKPSWNIPGYWVIDTTNGTPYFVDTYVHQATPSNIGIMRAVRDSILAVAPGNQGIILAGPRNGNGVSQKYCPYTTGYLGSIEYNEYYGEALLGGSNNMILSSI